MRRSEPRIIATPDRTKTGIVERFEGKRKMSEVVACDGNLVSTISLSYHGSLDLGPKLRKEALA